MDRLKELEKIYLQRIDNNQTNTNSKLVFFLLIAEGKKKEEKK